MAAFVRKLLFLIFTCAAALSNAREPSIIYLTWMHDPTTTMTVHWHTGDEERVSALHYRKMGDSQWEKKEGIYSQLPKTQFLAHTVEIDELEPNTDYQFRIVGNERICRFRTLPDRLSRPVRFVVGGDAYFYLSTLQRMNGEIAAKNPDFVVVGGDIAYTNGRRAIYKGKDWEINRWRTFLKEWKTRMIDSEGRMIPMVPVIGNHDIKPTTLSTSTATHLLFYELFATPEKGVPYRVLDAGSYLSLILLDSGHSFHIEGQQTKWLEKTLSERENMSYKMAAYHIAAFPSVYPFRGHGPKKLRAQWNPLFERYHLNVAFEHHNHAYKRTFPMKGNKIDPDGVVYMGDGSWGVTPRKPKKLWYLEKIAQANAVCLITLTPQKGTVEALTIQGKIIDSVETFPMNPLVVLNETRLLQN
jgi:hypothetical protein